MRLVLMRAAGGRKGGDDVYRLVLRLRLHQLLHRLQDPAHTMVKSVAVGLLGWSTA